MKKILLFFLLFPVLLFAQDILTKQEIIDELTVSIDEAVKVFPNPFTNHISVVSDGYEFDSILFDAAGKEIAFQYNNQNQIDTKSLSSGIYFLKLNLGNTEKVFKLIKE